VPRILLVDDDRNFLRALARSLRPFRHEWEVVTAPGGTEALELLGSKAVDVVVSDERMPGIGGAELLARVRERHPDTVRILLSGQCDLDAAARAINEAEVYRFLRKPCPPEELVATLRGALRVGERAARNGDDPAAHEELGAALDRALGSLRMVYQPILTADAATVFAHEALLRADVPRWAPPVWCLDVARRLGRTAELFARIRETVAHRLPEAPADTLVFVNVSPHEFSDKGLYDADSALGRRADRIALEVAERELLDEAHDAGTMVERLRRIGYRIAVDDLGSGYSGLNSVVRLSPNLVKLDQGLVRDIDTSSTKRSLVRSVCSACRELGIATVAEGVETLAEHRTVEELGADYVQGFLFGAGSEEFSRGAGEAA